MTATPAVGRVLPLADPFKSEFARVAEQGHSHKPTLATVFDYSCALAQGDWCLGPALTCGQVRCLRNLKVLDAGQVLYDVLAVSIPRIDAVSETGAIVYRHFFLPHSSSSSRFTAGASEFFILSQSGDRPER
jgi:hypothetical protein